MRVRDLAPETCENWTTCADGISPTGRTGVAMPVLVLATLGERSAWLELRHSVETLDANRRLRVVMVGT